MYEAIRLSACIYFINYTIRLKYVNSATIRDVHDYLLYFRVERVEILKGWENKSSHQEFGVFEFRL